MYVLASRWSWWSVMGRSRMCAHTLHQFKEPTPRDEALPIESVSQPGDLTVVKLAPAPHLSDQVIMLVVEFDTKRAGDYAAYRWRLNP